MTDSTITCTTCGNVSPLGFRFCGSCGAALAPAAAAAAPKTIFFGAMQQPNRAKLILIKGEGLDGVSYLLNSDQHVAGRTQGEIRFPDDPLLSPCHATFFYQDTALFVRDEGSENGVFVRIREPVEMFAGGRFLVGEQLIGLESIGSDAARPVTSADGTLLYGSPRRPGHFLLIQFLRGGPMGMIYRAPTSRVTLGREGNDINFPDDPFISGQHAAISTDANAGGPTSFVLTDLGSKNGTFVRIAEPQRLTHGDYVFLGQQLFRVEIT